MTLGIPKKKPVKESGSMCPLNTTNKLMTLGIPKKKNVQRSDSRGYLNTTWQEHH